jgi:hypothetical protein
MPEQQMAPMARVDHCSVMVPLLLSRTRCRQWWTTGRRAPVRLRRKGGSRVRSRRRSSYVSSTFLYSYHIREFIAREIARVAWPEWR